MSDPSHFVPEQKKLYFLQYLRGLAALMVVVHHAGNVTQWGTNPLKSWSYGQIGVDLFFVLSGFIMYYVGRNEQPLVFFAKRIARIVPMYWLVSIVVFIKAFWHNGFVYLFKTLAFIPYFYPVNANNLQDADRIWPILIPGWTVNYEMFFYVIFGIALLNKRLCSITFGTMLLLILVGVIIPIPHTGTFIEAVGRFYTDSIMLEFLAGMIIGYVFVSFHERAWFKYLMILPILGVALLFISLPDVPRAFKFGIPAVLIILGLLSAEQYFKPAPSRAGLLVGDASYSIYLIHTVIISGITKIVASAVSDDGTALKLFLIVFPVASLAAGILLHLLIEKPLTKWSLMQLLAMKNRIPS